MNNSEYIVKFITNLPQEFKITNNEISIQGSMNKNDLSQLIQQLLSAENPDQEFNQSFDFFVNGIALRTTLHDLIQQNEIVTETTLQIEYLFALPEPKLKQTITMNDWIISISKFNNQILTFLSNGDIVVCSEKGKILKTHKSNENAKSYSIQENIIIETCWNNKIYVYRLDEKLHLLASASIPSYGECSCFNKKNPNEFCVGTSNGELLFFDLNEVQNKTLEIKENFKVHQNQILGCEWIRYNTILTGSLDHSLVLFNRKTNKITKQMFAKDSSVNGFVYIENTQQIVSIHEDGYLKLWDSINEQLLKVYKTSLCSLNAIAINANNQIVVSSMDGNSYLWDLRGEVPLFQLNGEGKALACAWIDNKVLFGGSTNKLYIYSC